jgi:hypothetical protein
MSPRPPPSVVCDVGAVACPSLATVDAVARLALRVRRLGHDVRLRRASVELLELIALAGLAEVLRVEAGREAEEREERVGVEEEGELGDRPV